MIKEPKSGEDRLLRRRAFLAGLFGLGAAGTLPQAVYAEGAGEVLATFTKAMEDFVDVVMAIGRKNESILTDEQQLSSVGHAYGKAFRGVDDAQVAPGTLSRTSESLRKNFIATYRALPKPVDEDVLDMHKRRLVDDLSRVVFTHPPDDAQREALRKMLDSFWCGYEKEVFCPDLVS